MNILEAVLSMMERVASGMGLRISEIPLSGDRGIEHAFVVKNLVHLDKKEYQKVLDVGSYCSPLTSIVREIGFDVDSLDMARSPYSYEGVRFLQGDFLAMELGESSYDVVVLCSTVEHIGLKGRYGSDEVIDGDLIAIDKVYQILRPGGLLIMTVPFGQEQVIRPYHRVYSRDGRLLARVSEGFDLLQKEFYKNNDDNVWTKCSENEAGNTVPSKSNYSLGLFAFEKRS